VAASTVNSKIPTFQDFGGYIGASVSGTFLIIIGILNLLVLMDILRIYRDAKRGSLDQQKLEERLHDRGFMNRFFVGRFARRIRSSWQMYPLGVLFGLGFDTATEVGARCRRGDAPRAGPCDPLAPDPVRRRHVPDGHRGRRVHEPGVRLGVL
jgi:high-affinity nickel-transport protein